MKNCETGSKLDFFSFPYKILRMSAKKYILCMTAACLSAAVPVCAEETDIETEQEVLLVHLTTADLSPLETIKEEVIAYRADQSLLDLSTVNIENSTIAIDQFEQGKTGIFKATANVTLASVETEEGSSEITLAYSFSQPLYLTVETDGNPQILLSCDEVSIEEGETFDPASYISWLYDDGSMYPLISVDNPVDTSVPGEYTVTYTVSDFDGNKTAASMNVTVEQMVYIWGQNISVNDLIFDDDGSVYAMFEAINEVRALYGLYPFELAEDAAMAAASIRAQEASSYLAHVRPDGTHYRTAFDDVGLYGVFPKEILVCCGPSVESNLNWWMNEPGHARIVLDSTCTRIALGKYGNMFCGEVY